MSIANPSAVRRFFWPIYGEENRRFFLMALMITFILFNYTVVRNLKDALVVTEGGSETIAFLKVWVVVPLAFLAFVIYSKLTNMMNKQAVFKTIVLSFVGFFALFAFVIYPNRELLHPTTSADWLQSALPPGMKGFVSMYRFWTYSLFYAMAELWGSVVQALLFFQFANDITRVSEAKRFYPHFYLIGNIGVIFAGWSTRYFSTIQKSLPAGVDPWQISLNYLLGAVTVFGLFVVGIYTYLNRYVIPHVQIAPEEQKQKKSKAKMGVMDSIRLIMHSKYIGLITLLILCYGISVNLVEVSWKNQVAMQYPSKNEYGQFMGLLTIYIGFGTIIAILFGGWILRNLGWRIAALATPLMLGTTGMMFFACIVFPDFFAPLTAILDTTPLMLAVIFGFAQYVLSKCTKYALFDPTKEMSYIPLDDELKSKGKAAADVIGGRLGKSGGSFLQQGMFAVIGPISVIAPYSAFFVLVIVAIWIMAVFGLHKRFSALSSEKV